jgi:hypothetical protein
VECGADCPAPYYGADRPPVPTLPDQALVRTFIHMPAENVPPYLSLRVTAVDWRGDWTVGNFLGAGSWNGSFLFDGHMVHCCVTDERWAIAVNSYGDYLSYDFSGVFVQMVGVAGEIAFDRSLHITAIDDNDTLYGNGFILQLVQPIHAMPEPATWLMLVGALSLGWIKRTSRR